LRIKIVEKLRTPKGKVNWGRKVVPKKRQCNMQIFIPQGGVIVDCFWEFEVILPNGSFLLGTLCFLGEVWDLEVVENKLEATR
jgi:hypothetical protein